ncbi:MAG: ATPase, T2SS/T4P/T4SS family, partial [Dolichospermum sp.]
IITIEDPIEFVHQSRKSLIRQREVGMHTLKFDNALKAALRADPDIILLGEMRDKETFTSWLREILSDEEIQSFQKQLEFDGAVQYDFVRVRINIFDALGGYGMVLRLIPLEIMSIEQLCLPPIIQDICN